VSGTAQHSCHQKFFVQKDGLVEFTVEVAVATNDLAGALGEARPKGGVAGESD
jgi:hypothetical protein